MFRGIIIEESLSDTSVLSDVRIVKTDIKPVTEKHKTPWVTQWTLHEVEVSEDQIGAIAERLSYAIDAAHASSWYADLKNDTTHYVIFSHKVFVIDRSQKSEYDAATAYGMSIGIPEYQLDFSSYLTE